MAFLFVSRPTFAPTPDGGTAIVGAVETHLARSGDKGASWAFVKALWPTVDAIDAEGSGEKGLASSEVSSIVATRETGIVTWYRSHITHFLRPADGYNPKFTSWLIRVSWLREGRARQTRRKRKGRELSK